jgi:aconitate hydratase
MPGEDRAKLGLTGEESFTVRGLDRIAPKATVEVEATRADGSTVRFKTLARVDDPVDVEYLRHGGVLPLVLREVLARS